MKKLPGPEMWDQRYAQETYAYGEEPNLFLTQTYHDIPIGPVLCLAEGEGRNAVYLAHQGYEVTAVDFSEEGIRKTQKLAQQNKVRVDTIQTDLVHFNISENTWQGIVAFFAHLPKALRKKVHRDVVAGLRPGGIFLLEAFTPRQLLFNSGGPKNPELLLSLRDLQTELEGLIPIIARETDRELDEGVYHSGKAAVVQFVGKKPV